MKIIFLSDDFPPRSFGGAGIIAFNIAKNLQKRGHEVFVVTTTQDRSSEGESTYEGLKIFKIYSSYHPQWRAYLSIYNPRVVKKVHKIIRQISPDIVHAHNIHTHISYFSLKIARRYARGVFLTAHDAMAFAYGKIMDNNKYKISPWGQFTENKFRYNPLRNFFIKRYLKDVNKIFSVSDALREALIDNDIKNVETVHNGINPTDWLVDEKELELFKKKYNLDKKKVIFFGGRLSGLKGTDVVLDAMSIVVKKNPDAVLLVAGEEGRHAKKIIKRAKEIGIGENILFTGWIERDKMKYAYASSDLVVVASLYLDPFPTVNLESMALRKPVVGTCFGGTREIVLDKETGYIVDPNEIETFAEKVMILLEDDKVNRQFGEKGYKRVIENFSEDRQVEKILSWYDIATKEKNMSKISLFYDKESVLYSQKRYEGVTDTYVKFLFNKRLNILLGYLNRIIDKNSQYLLLDVGCADGAVTQKIDIAFPSSFKKIVGIDISPEMVEVARKKNQKSKISFFLRGKEEEQQERYDFILEVGFLAPHLFKDEFLFLDHNLKKGGYFICSLSPKNSLHARIKLRDETYIKGYLTYPEYEAILSEHFEIIAKEPYGLFVPKLWAFPLLARCLQPFFELSFKYIAPSLFHEKIYLLKKK